MLPEYAIIREAATRIAEAASSTVQDLREHLIEHEPQFTDRMLGRIAEAMNGFRSGGVYWRAKTLTSGAPNSQEHRFGVDFLGVLSIDLPNYTVTKGFLVQAKLLGKRSFREEDRVRMLGQCQKMLSMSPASYVFTYSDSGIRVVPASSVLASGRIDMRAYYSRSIERFYEEHFACFFGDREVSVPSERLLAVLLARYEARQGLWLGAESIEAGGEHPQEPETPVVWPQNQALHRTAEFAPIRR